MTTSEMTATSAATTAPEMTEIETTMTATVTEAAVETVTAVAGTTMKQAIMMI
jgi:hypothetical protein